MSVGKKIGIYLVGVILLLSACGPNAPTWQEQYDLGVRYLSEGNYEEAIIAFTAAIEIDPKQAPAFVGRGDAFVGTAQTGSDGEYIKAEKDYLAAIDLDALVVEVYEKLADVYLAIGEPEKALDILHKGYDATGDEGLLERADEVSGNVPVVWSDPTLEQMVRGAIGILDGTVYVKDLDYIYRLTILGDTHIFINDESISGDWWYRGCSNSGDGTPYILKSFYGIGRFDSYTTRGKIVDISSLRYFRNLTYVDVIANHVADISVLHDLELKSATFFANDIDDTSLLADIGGDGPQEQFIEIGDIVVEE